MATVAIANTDRDGQLPSERRECDVRPSQRVESVEVVLNADCGFAIKRARKHQEVAAVRTTKNRSRGRDELREQLGNRCVEREPYPEPHWQCLVQLAVNIK